MTQIRFMISFVHMMTNPSDRIRLLILLGLLCLLTAPVGGTARAQEFENLDSTYKDREPSYYARLSVEYLDNERDTEETGYYDLSQRRVQKEGNGSLKLYFFNLDGHYKAYDSRTRIGEDKTRLSSIRDTINARVELLEYIYVFAQGRDLDWRYRHVDDGVEDFYESESATAILQGIGLVLGDWRFGAALDTSYSWTYRVKVETRSIISENIGFKVNVWELVKKAGNTQGPFYELGLKSWNDSSVEDDRNGSLQRSEGFVFLGIGFSENTAAYVGGKASAGRIESRLLSDNSSALRETDTTSNVFGIRFGLGEQSSIYIEQHFLNQRIDFKNIVYENAHHYRERKLTVGTRINNRFSFELKFGRTYIDKSYTERVVNNQSYRYQQEDNLVGISLNVRFSE